MRIVPLRAALIVGAALSLTASAAVAAPAPAPAAATTAVQRWLAEPLPEAAHRGGSDDWPEGTLLAYRKAVAWNAALALDVPVWRSADGRWVVSHDATTGRVFGTDLDIRSSTWAQLAPLRTVDGAQPITTLDAVLQTVPRSTVVMVDDKADQDPSGLLGLLASYGGPKRTVLKCFWQTKAVPAAARAAGYTTWGYYYADQLASFDTTQQRFDVLAMEWAAPPAAWKRLLATGKRVFGHVVDTPAQAEQATGLGATGLMVAGVKAVVPRD